MLKISLNSPFTIVCSVFFLSLSTCKEKNDFQDQSGQTIPPGFTEISYSYNPDQIYPKAKGLRLPEDGFALSTDSIVVADDSLGLLLVTDDGVKRQFANLTAAGYRNDGARGVYLNSQDQKAYVSCMNTGKIFEVDIRKETARLIYQHSHGVNNIYVDKRNFLWFTQSFEKTYGDHRDQDSAFATPVPSGMLYRLDLSEKNKQAKVMADSLYFANGITMNKEENKVFVSEFRMNRVIVFDLDETWIPTAKKLFVSVISPDNLERGPNDGIWIASLVSNSVFKIHESGNHQQKIFTAPSVVNNEVQLEWSDKGQRGLSVIDVARPGMFDPVGMPITGMFFSPEHLYITGLSDHLLRIKMTEKL
ncbi:SMP-30/gluconolactonase/LRE family protein [Robertkochia aurantiaca]|uniref:SMP-30/gluconolactonase/LRE family protein n=1 Tax=Robertkochia aurantiaca TaxID=2873700 RepID=UPI001CCF92EA|nr:SMP-30/gluconolactonase/LRE family protein [Robertkochia sp. 3YJGBD-33]